MTLEKYIQGLNDFVKENPETLQLDVITSSDDEGNGYNYIYYQPSKGLYEDGEFKSEDDFNYEGEYNINTVCVN